MDGDLRHNKIYKNNRLMLSEDADIMEHLPLIISSISSVVSVSVAVAAFYFARKKDTREDTAQIMDMQSDVRSTRDNVAEIKAEIKGIRTDWMRDHDDLVTVKSKVEALGNRIDELRFIIQAD